MVVLSHFNQPIVSRAAAQNHHKDADGKTSVKFGVLFNDDQCANLFEALVGTLKAAKRKKIITFEGELLLQGVHDNVDVILLQD
ncbi:costars family ABRACL [Labeo rohita]|uniref:Costars family protein ABRACL n=1 Tax=Labeo rohita TaxID=84645 RepID=A0A498LGT9_LABRO|nr:costars family ABRACL [Labeo rohita]